jgi:protein-disulfide isomerase
MVGLSRSVLIAWGTAGLLALAGCAGSPLSGLTTTSDTVSSTTEAAGFVAGSTPDQLNADQQQLAPIEHPTKADLAVTGPLPDRVLGKANAPVTVIEYASLTCPHCSAFHRLYFEQVKKAYIDTGKVKWVLREFPIGHTSGAAWIVNRCAPDAMYFKLYDAFMRNQPEWVSLEVRPDAIAAVAAKAGMTRAQFDACWNNPTADAGLRWVKARGRQLGVTGTPTFFIGETKVRAVPSLEDFGAMIEAEMASPGSSYQVAIARSLVPKPSLQ